MRERSLAIGVDYGTDSVRSLIVDTATGNELASAVYYYPRWKQQQYCNASTNQFRQHPLDYIEGLEQSIKSCLSQLSPEDISQIRALSVDTTGSTPVIVDKTGTPLGLIPEFSDNPNALFILWKDHTAVEEAAEINRHAKDFDVNYLQYVGGIYSSEWFWAKWLHVLREDKAVREAGYSLVEHCDWIPFLLTGGRDIHELKRSVCAAGHKGLWSAAFGGFPPNDFFSSLDPLLDGLVDHLQQEVLASDKPAGIIAKEWANRLGLPETVVIGVGAFDAHMGAVGGQIEPYQLSKVMGTSTCDMLVAPAEEMGDQVTYGICGQVAGSVIPGMIGLEAGQSAFGDLYAWFRKILAWPLEALKDEEEKQRLIDNMIPALTEAASKLNWNENSPLAVDWMNGRRTPDANQELKGLITNLNIGTDAPEIFYAIVEASCFGAKAIVDRFREENVPVKGLIGLGGVAKKAPFIMQMMADIMNMPIRIHKSEQTCALGAAMFAATAAGIFDKVENAMEAMGQGFEKTYYPNDLKAPLYAARYKRYKEWGGYMESSVSSQKQKKAKTQSI